MNFPPSDFEQLRQVVMLIRNGKLDLPIGKKSLSGLEMMMNAPEFVASNNIVELSEKTLLSPASITRLSKLFGFKGFNQFRSVFKLKSKVPNNFYSAAVKKLLDQNNNSPKQILLAQFNAMTENISECIGQSADIDADLASASSLLAKKQRVFVFGYRQSSALANILRYGLALIRPNVQMLVQADHGVAIALGQVRKNDLLVVIGSAPYSNRTVKITSLASEQGCNILAITDSELSPLCEFASVSICIPTKGEFYTNSLVANCFFVESLLCLTAIELGQVAVNNLEKHELLLSNLDVAT